MQVSLSLFNRFLDLLIPPRCVKCSSIVESKEGLCTVCWPLISFIAKPYCACCGRPFDFDIGEGALCGACSYEAPHYTTARSVFVYEASSRDLILKFKHTDSIHSAPLFSRWMVKSLDDLKNPLCVPVPLHWTRLLMRTYNQSALLAREIAKIKNWGYCPSLLKRKRRTPSQGHLSKKERVKNIENAFEVPSTKRECLTQQTILLIDDVFTTGATLNACSKVLLKAGAREVHALTLGRVLTARR